MSRSFVDWSELSLQVMITFGHFLWQACAVAIVLALVEQLTLIVYNAVVYGRARGLVPNGLRRSANERYKSTSIAFTRRSMTVGAAIASLLVVSLAAWGQNQLPTDDKAASDQQDSDEPVQSIDAAVLLAELQAHDRAFDNRSIEMEQRYVQTIYRNALSDASRWNAVRFGQEDLGPSPSVPDIKQPHRIRHLLSVRGNEIAIENLGDLEPIIDPQWVMNYRGARTVYLKDSVLRWIPEHPDLPILIFQSAVGHFL